MTAGLRYSLTTAIYVCAYVALDWASFIHPLAQLAITPWNPPPGLSLFLLLRYGLRYAPALFAAAVMADIVVRGSALDAWGALAPALLLACGYTAVGAWLARKQGVGRSLAGLADVNRLVVAALAGPLLIAPAYVGLHVVLGDLRDSEFAAACIQFWIGDAIGIVVTTPLLLEFAERRIAFRRKPDTEFILQAVAVLAALWVVFGIEATDEFKFFYMLFLPLIWVAMRRGLRGAVVVSLVIQLGVIAAAESIGAKGIPLRELQFLMLALALTALYLGMAVNEREAARRSIAARELALNRALRMATAGELAAAVAHELNQPLAAIGNYVRACMLMQDRPASDPLLRETLGKVGHEVTRAGEVVRRLRDFYRTGSARRVRETPRALVMTATEALGPRLAENHVQIDVDCAPDLPQVEVDVIQMQAVLHNLVGNAVEALAATESSQRRIRIAASAKPEGVVQITIADNGPGVAAEVANRLFEPFTSTKPDGMGLGLAMSRSIVEAHGGHLALRSAEAPGAVFELTLPAVHEHEHEHEPGG